MGGSSQDLLTVKYVLACRTKVKGVSMGRVVEGWYMGGSKWVSLRLRQRKWVYGCVCLGGTGDLAIGKGPCKGGVCRWGCKGVGGAARGQGC